MELVFQIAKFAFVGLINTLITIVVFNILLYLNINYLLANIVGYFAGVLNSLILNSNWVFKTDRMYLQLVIKFIAVNIFSLIVNSSLLYILVNTLHFDVKVSQLVAISFSMVINFLLNKIWTYNSKEEPEIK